MWSDLVRIANILPIEEKEFFRRGISSVFAESFFDIA